MPDIQVTKICSRSNLLLKYHWYLDPTDNQGAVDLGLQNIQKYLKYTA